MDFSKFPVVYAPKLPLPVSPLCGMLERQLAKSVGNNVSQCQPPKRKGQSQDSATSIAIQWVTLLANY